MFLKNTIETLYSVTVLVLNEKILTFDIELRIFKRC